MPVWKHFAAANCTGIMIFKRLYLYTWSSASRSRSSMNIIRTRYAKNKKGHPLFPPVHPLYALYLIAGFLPLENFPRSTTYSPCIGPSHSTQSLYSSCFSHSLVASQDAKMPAKQFQGHERSEETGGSGGPCTLLSILLDKT